MEKLDLLVVADPHPTTFAALVRPARRHLPPADLHLARDATARARPRTARCNGASRSSKPIFESKDDYEVMYLAREEARLRRADVQEHQGQDTKPVAEDILREINRGGWSTGYCGQSPERLKAHMKNQDKFDLVTLRAPKDDPEVGGDYYGLPWPCWGKPEIRHPGSPILYNTNAAREGRRRRPSGPASASSATARRCSPRAPTPRARS